MESLAKLTKEELHALIENPSYDGLLIDIAAELRRRRENKIIVPTKECNIGDGECTVNQAGNAIWNKLNIVLSLTNYIHNDGDTYFEQAVDYIKEAREIADLITQV